MDERYVRRCAWCEKLLTPWDFPTICTEGHGSRLCLFCFGCQKELRRIRGYLDLPEWKSMHINETELREALPIDYKVSTEFRWYHLVLKKLKK